eukprot:2812824-Rhodomonas_salina.1
MAPPVCNTLLTFGIINSLYAVLGTKLFSERLPGACGGPGSVRNLLDDLVLAAAARDVGQLERGHRAAADGAGDERVGGGLLRELHRRRQPHRHERHGRRPPRGLHGRPHPPRDQGPRASLDLI